MLWGCGAGMGAQGATFPSLGTAQARTHQKPSSKPHAGEPIEPGIRAFAPRRKELTSSKKPVIYSRGEVRIGPGRRAISTVVNEGKSPSHGWRGYDKNEYGYRQAPFSVLRKESVVVAAVSEKLTAGKLERAIRLFARCWPQLTCGYIFLGPQLVFAFIREPKPGEGTLFETPRLPAGLAIGRLVVQPLDVPMALLDMMNSGFPLPNGQELPLRDMQASLMDIPAFAGRYPPGLGVSGLGFFAEGATGEPKGMDALRAKLLQLEFDPYEHDYDSLGAATSDILGVRVSASTWTGAAYCVLGLPGDLRCAEDNLVLNLSLTLPQVFAHEPVEIRRRFEDGMFDDLPSHEIHQTIGDGVRRMSWAGASAKWKNQATTQPQQTREVRAYIDGFPCASFVLPTHENGSPTPRISALSSTSIGGDGMPTGARATVQRGGELTIPAPQVFISYSHDSKPHKESILILADRLRRDGVDCTIDQYLESPPEGWPSWMKEQMQLANYVLVVCTEGYLAKFENIGKAEPGGLGVRWEGAVITSEIYESGGRNEKFIPVLLKSHDELYRPSILNSATYYALDSDEQYDQLYRRLTGQPATPKPPLGPRRTLPPVQVLHPTSAASAMGGTGFSITDPETATERTGSNRARATPPVEVSPLAQAPLVRLDSGGGTAGNVRIGYKNVGEEPALNFRCWIEDPEHPGLRSPHKGIYMAVVAVGEGNGSGQIIPTEIPGYNLGSGLGYLRAQYEDRSGITYESMLIIPPVGQPEFKYGKATERVLLG